MAEPAYTYRKKADTVTAVRIPEDPHAQIDLALELGVTLQTDALRRVTFRTSNGIAKAGAYLVWNGDGEVRVASSLDFEEEYERADA